MTSMACSESTDPEGRFYSKLSLCPPLKATLGECDKGQFLTVGIAMILGHLGLRNHILQSVPRVFFLGMCEISLEEGS